MTNDERVRPIVEEWLEATSVTPPDAEQSVDQVMTDLLRQSQLRPWWPSRILRRRAPKDRGSSMFSAVKFVVAAVIVALFGGFLLSGVLNTQQDHELAPAAVTASPSLVPVPDLSGSSLVNQVQDLALAPDGTVWAATRGGVVRWDEGAATPVVYGEQDGLPAADVDRVVVAGDGTAWAAGHDWLTFYDQTWQPVEAVTGLGAMETAFDDVIAADPTGGVLALGQDGEGSEAIFLIDRGGAEQIVGLPEGRVPEVEMAVDSAGRFWMVDRVDARGVFVHDEGGWQELATTAPPFGDPFHYLVSNIAIAPDGTAWISTMRDSDPEPGGTAAPGVASSDGQTWTTYTTADGLAADAGTVVIAADGTVWVVHDDAVSRRDGDTWTAYDVAGSVRRSGGVGGSDGTLWLATDDGILRFDGETTTRFVVPADMTPDPLSFSLESVGPAAPSVDAGSFGQVAWQQFDVPTGHWLMGGIATADGFAANERTSVRTSSDGVDWVTTEPRVESRHLIASGEDLYALGGGVVRLARTGTTWAVVDQLTIPDPGPEIRSEPGYLDFAEHMAFGDGVTVTTARSRIFFSDDGHTFSPALRGPDAALLEGAGEPDSDDYGPTGGCRPSWSSSGEDSIGPVFATGSGFVAFTSAHPNDWNNSPLCRPIIWTSNDGSTWDLVSSESPFGPDAYVHAMAERDGRIVAVGGRGHDDEGVLWVSDDGLTWNEILPERISGSITSVPWAIAAGEAGWVILYGQSGTAGEVRAMYSLDGLDWVAAADDLPGLWWAWGAPDVAVGKDRILVTYYDGVALIGEITR